jgi:peptidoglycan/LPS O-acetylase OafA/YrhL
MMAIRPAGRGRIAEMDGLRALAVGAVMIEHFAGGPIRHVLPWGAFGVQAFFALSGFLITSLLLEARRRMDEGGGLAAALRRFLAGRTLRIFPVYYLTLVLTALLGVEEIRADFPWFFFYSSNFLFAHEGMWRGPGSHFWSLAVEEQFYLFWPWIILLSPRRLLGRLVCGMIAIGPVSRLIVHAMGLSDVAVLVLPMCNLDVLGMGALLAIVRRHEGEKLARWGAWIGTPISVVLLALRAAGGAATITVVTLPLALSAVWLAVIRWSVSDGDSAIRRAIKAAPLTYLGRISYGVYVYHLFMPLLLWNCLGLYDTVGGVPGLAFALLVASSVAAGSLSWHFFERPLSRLPKLRMWREARAS